MKRGIFFLLSFFLSVIFFLFASCKEEIITDYPTLKDGTELPADLDSVKLNYDSFFTIKYGLGYPYLKIKNEFYFFVKSYLQLFKYNLVDSTWQSNFLYSTDEYKSSDKYFLTSGDSIVMVSYFNTNHSIDVYSIDKGTLTLRPLKKGLLLGVDLYSSIQFSVLLDNNKLILLRHSEDKILTIDLKNYSMRSVPDNHLNGIRHDSGVNNAAMIGKWGRDIYLYYYSFKRFFRFNLDTYVFTEISVPKYVSAMMSAIWDRGGTVGSIFCFWPNDSYFTLCYDVNKNRWANGGLNPFYQKWYMPLDYTYEGSYSYFKDGSIMRRIGVK